MSLGKRIKGISLWTAVALALYASGFLVIFTPLPILYVSVVGGRRDALISTILGAGAVVGAYAAALAYAAKAAVPGASAIPAPAMSMAPFFKPAYVWIAGAGYFLFFALIAIALGAGVRRRWALMRWGGTAFIAGLVAMAALMGSGAYLQVQGGGFAGYLTGMVKDVVSLNASAGAGSAELSFLAENAGEIVSTVIGLAPSILFVFVLVTVVVNMLLARRMIRGRHAFSHIHNVARFRLPDACVWGVIAGGVAFFTNSYFAHSAALKLAAINVLVACAALYFFQGLAVVVYFLQGVRAPLLRTMAYVAIIFFFQSIGMLIVAIGVADVWMDFRLRSWRARHMHRHEDGSRESGPED